MSVYVAVPPDGSSIRLLELQPGQPDDDLVGKFVVHNLANAQPRYTATSYVCGNDDRSQYYITMSGTRLGIYKNADEVLRRFRSETRVTHLWIDVVSLSLPKTSLIG
jgi:hypothetical protein